MLYFPQRKHCNLYKAFFCNFAQNIVSFMDLLRPYGSDQITLYETITTKII